ncbi:plasmid transfer protein TraB [Streptomyces sp. NPDC046866]|uniref:plasmid transfer protein TraB n=1 Tax=Streptomyces sp. NPDC046866 TaxID=3154921 RepID=UPI00345432AD
MGSDIEKVNQAAEARLNGESSAGGVKGWLFHRAKPFLPPWVVAGGVGVASVPAALAWQGAPFAGIGLTLASGGLTAAAWFAAKPTGRQRRLHSAVTVAAAGSWFTCASVAGPWSGPLPDLYFMGGAALAISWNIRQVLRWNPDAVPAADSAGLLEKVGLAKALIKGAKVEPNRVTVPLELAAGEQTNDDVTRALPLIASGLDVPPAAIRYLPDPDSARRGELVIVPMDMLGEAVRWEETGPSLPGGSITDPLVIGVYDDGTPLQLWLPGDPTVGRNATHVLIAGMTGAGKGDGALNLMTEILSRKDVIFWLNDPKGFQDFRHLLPGMDWATDASGTETMATAVLPVIQARTAWLGKHGYRQWNIRASVKQDDPAHTCRADGTACGCPGMPFLVTWFEEAGVSLSVLGDDAFNNVANLARSGGVAFIVSLQRPSHDQISTTTRDALGSRLCFGVPNATAAGFMLPDNVLDAGAAPERWSNRRPGYCYLVTPGVDEARYSSPGRTRWFTPTANTLMETVAAWAARKGAKPDPITADAAAKAVGRAYTERDQHTPNQPAVEEDDVTGEPLVDEEDTHIDPERDLDDSETGDDTPIFGATPGRQPGPKEARQLFAQAITEFESAGQMVVGPKDFMDWAGRHQLSRAWVSGRLKEAALEGRLEHTSKAGRWRIVPQLVDA